MATLRSFGIQLVFVLCMTSLLKKEVDCLAVKHSGEKLWGGVSDSLARHERSTADCSLQSGSDGPITTVTRAKEVLCYLSVKRFLCNIQCEENIMQSPTLQINSSLADEETSLMFYFHAGGKVYLGCEIGLTFRNNPQPPLLNITCNDFGKRPCKEERHSSDDIPSCSQCYPNGLPQLTCAPKDDKASIPEKIAQDEKSALIGGVVGGVVGVLLIVVIVVVICMRCKRQRHNDVKLETSNMKVITQEKEDISDDDSSSDIVQGVDQSQSVNQYESITELETRHFGRRNRLATDDDYTYIQDRDLERKNKFRKGQDGSTLPINQHTTNCVGGEDNDAYNRLGDSVPLSQPQTNSPNANEVAQSTYNHFGNTNDAYSHAGDSTQSETKDTYNRLDGANNDNGIDAYNRTGSQHNTGTLDHAHENRDTYNHLGAGNDVINKGVTYNRVGGSNSISKTTDNYHCLEDVDRMVKPDASLYFGEEGDVRNDVDAYNHLGNTNPDVNETDTYNHIGNTKQTDNETDTYNHIGNTKQTDNEPDTYNHVSNSGQAVNERDTYNHVGNTNQNVNEPNTYNHVDNTNQGIEETNTNNHVAKPNEDVNEPDTDNQIVKTDQTINDPDTYNHVCNTNHDVNEPDHDHHAVDSCA